MGTRLLLSSLAAILLASVPAPAQWRSSRPAEPATSQPAVDHVKDLFDTYTQGRERDRFFAAAGVDSVLTTEEYQAASSKKDGFVRSYDSWEAAVALDADKNGKLSWAEAEKYREGIRQSLLKLFDKNRDGKLTGAERDEANRYLSRKLRAPGADQGWGFGQLNRQYDANGDGQLDEKERAAMEKAQADQRAADEQRRKEMLEKYDTNGDGQISGDERRAMYQDWRDRQEKERLDRWDADKNGQLDEKELQAEREQQQAEARRRMEEWTIRRHDKDGDGKLNEQEQAAADAERKQWEDVAQQARQRMQEWQNRWDRDGDGQLSDEERRVATDQARQELDRRRQEMDTDGDGQVSADETQAYLKKLTEKYDADGDGQLCAQERWEMIRQESRSFMPGRGGSSSEEGQDPGRGGRGRRGGRRGRRPDAPAEGSQTPAGGGQTAPAVIQTSP